MPRRCESDTIAKAYGGPMTGHTFTGHTACCAAGVAVQKIIQRDKLVERVKAYEPKLKKMIADATQGIEADGDIRGRGYFIGTDYGILNISGRLAISMALAGLGEWLLVGATIGSVYKRAGSAAIVW